MGNIYGKARPCQFFKYIIIIYPFLDAILIFSYKNFVVQVNYQFSLSSSFLANTSDIDDLLEGLDGVLEDWLNGLYDTESFLDAVDLWLHTFDGFHLSGNFNE